MQSENSDKFFLIVWSMVSNDFYIPNSAPCVSAINGKILYRKPNSSPWDHAFREKMYKETKSSPCDQRVLL